jgi:putative transposase
MNSSLSNQIKNKKIKESLAQTKSRRLLLLCKVYKLKIDLSRLSKQTKEHLNLLFLQAKWFRNAILSSEDIFSFDTKVKEVQVKVGDCFEQRSLSVLSSQMKQSILTQIKSDISGLSSKKKKGHQVGKLKFKSWVGSIELKQPNNTYTLSLNGRLKIQKLKQTDLYVDA